jgi:hypothetical protein
MLDPSFGRRLQPPLFLLVDASSRWGSWSADRREIRLSRALVFGHPWEAVREVLFHEMAHQLADEVLGAGGEPPHGPLFRTACDLLGADPRASGSLVPAIERLRQAGTGGEDRQSRRIRKLLALAGSSNPHEAEAAMHKAHRLMDGRESAARISGRAREFFSIFVGRPALRYDRAFYHLAALLRDFYFVLPIWVPAYVAEKTRMGRVLEISGTPSHLRTAAYVHAFIQRVIADEWRQLVGRGGSDRRGSALFGVGVVEGFRTRLEAGRRADAKTASSALVRGVDPALVHYFKHRHPRTRRIGHAALDAHRRALAAGREVGRRLVLSQPAAAIGGSGGLLPGAGRP